MRPIFQFLSGAMLMAALGSAVNAGAAMIINFDTDAGGNPLTAPSFFSATTPLTTLYAPLGVSFSGPAAGQGSAILNTGAAFGVGAHSGNNFLAFNAGLGTYPNAPETITFASLVDSASIFVSGGFNAASFTLSAFGASNNLLASDTHVGQAGSYSLFSTASPAGIKFVTLSTTGSGIFVADDLAIGNAVVAGGGASVPLPAGLYGALFLVAALAAWPWFRSAQCSDH